MFNFINFPTFWSNQVLCELAQQPLRPTETAEMKPKLYRTLLKGIKEQGQIRRDKQLFQLVPFQTASELYSNVYKSKSAISLQITSQMLVPWVGFDQPLRE